MPRINPSQKFASSEPEDQTGTSCGTMSDDDSVYSDPDAQTGRKENGLFLKRIVSSDPEYDVASRPPTIEEPDDGDEPLDSCQVCHKPMPGETDLHKSRGSATNINNQDVDSARIHDHQRRASDSSSKKLFQQILQNVAPPLHAKDIHHGELSKKKLDSSDPHMKPNKKQLLSVNEQALTPLAPLPAKMEKSLERPCQTFKLAAFQCVENGTRKLLWKLGYQLSKIPILLLIVALLVCALSMIGVIVRRQNLDFKPPFNSYYSSEESVTLAESRESIFNDSNGRYDALQRISGLDFAVIMKTVDFGNILKEDVFDNYLRLKKSLEDIKIVGSGKIYKYSTLCRHSQDTCEMDPVQAIMTSGQNIKFQYPEMEIPRPNKNSTLMFLGNTFGGVETDQDGAIAKAQTLAMYFKLKSNPNDVDDQYGLVKQWDQEFQRLVTKEDQKLKQVVLSWWSFGAFSQSVINTFKAIYVYLGISLGIICVGCVVACFITHGLNGRRWVIMGAVGALVIFCTVGSSISADIGITGYLNPATFPTYFMTAASSMFLIINMMQSWNKYNNIIINPAEKLRFIMCWECPSIFMMCIILAVSYAIVALSSSNPLFRSICQLAGFGYIILILLVLLLFNCLLYLFGNREILNGKLLQMDEKGAALFSAPLLRRYNLRDIELLHTKFLDKSPCISQKIAEILSSVHVRFLILLAFCAYLIFGIWGCAMVPVHISERHYLRLSADVDMTNFLDDYDRYYARYDNYVELIFGNPVDYFSSKVRTSVNDILTWVDFEQHLSDKVVSWLRDFSEFEKNSIYLINRDTFVPVVDLIFLRDERYKKYTNDVALGKYNEQIIGSRMYLELNKIGLNRQLEIVKFIANRAKDSSLPVSIKAPNLFLLQHDLEIHTQIILSFSLIICLTSIFTLVAYAQPLLTILHFLCMVSTTMGTIGFAALWNVPLNAVNEATVLAGMSYTSILCVTCCYFYNNAKFSGAKDRLIYTFRSMLHGCIWSGCVTIVAFLPLLVVDCELIIHQSKLIFFHCVFSMVHCCLFLPPCLILCSTSAAVFCRSLKEMCQESCCCCDTEEDATSIYYIPTGGRTMDPLYIQQFYKIKFREDISAPKPLPAPPRREMLLPSSNQMKMARDAPPPDVALGPGHYLRSQKKPRMESNRSSFQTDSSEPLPQLYRYGSEFVEPSGDFQQQNRNRQHNYPAGSMNQGRKPQKPPRKKHSRSTSPPLHNQHRAMETTEDNYSEPSDPENVVVENLDHKKKSRKPRRRAVSETSSGMPGSIDEHKFDPYVDSNENLDDASEMDEAERAKSKNRISYAKWTKEVPVNAFTTERVTAEQYTIEGDSNRLELPPDWKRFWLNGNLRQPPSGPHPMSSHRENDGIGMVPTSDHHRPLHTHNMQMPPPRYGYQPQHGMPPQEHHFYGGERPQRMYNGPTGPHQEFVHPVPPNIHQFGPGPMRPSRNYSKPAHW